MHHLFSRAEHLGTTARPKEMARRSIRQGYVISLVPQPKRCHAGGPDRVAHHLSGCRHQAVRSSKIRHGSSLWTGNLFSRAECTPWDHSPSQSAPSAARGVVPTPPGPSTAPCRCRCCPPPASGGGAACSPRPVGAVPMEVKSQPSFGERRHSRKGSKKAVRQRAKAV